MKNKILSLCLASFLCLGFVACSAEATDEQTSSTLESENSQTESSEESKSDYTQKAFELVINDEIVAPGMVLSEDLLASFGTENEKLSAPSCHFDGEDVIYYYDDFNIYSYTDGDDQVIYLAELVSDKIALASGVKIGMSKDEATALQGSEFTQEGLVLRYEIDGVYIDLSLDENENISLIEILID